MSDDLIKRLENAQGPDRLLDAAIWEVADPKAFSVTKTSRLAFTNRDWSEEERERNAIAIARKYVPHYTASIDAALTLVPEGYCWSRVPGRVEIIKEEHYGDPFVEPYSSNARWITIALCIAALRARAAIAAKTEIAT